MGGGRHLAHLLDDCNVRHAHAAVEVRLGAEQKLLPRHAAPHGEDLKKKQKKNLSVASD